MPYETDDIRLGEWQEVRAFEPALQYDPRTGSLWQAEIVRRERSIRMKPIAQMTCPPDKHSYEPLKDGRRRGGRILAKCRRCPKRIVDPGIVGVWEGQS